MPSTGDTVARLHAGIFVMSRGMWFHFLREWVCSAFFPTGMHSMQEHFTQWVLQKLGKHC